MGFAPVPNAPTSTLSAVPSMLTAPKVSPRRSSTRLPSYEAGSVVRCSAPAGAPAKLPLVETTTVFRPGQWFAGFVTVMVTVEVLEAAMRVARTVTVYVPGTSNT